MKRYAVLIAALLLLAALMPAAAADLEPAPEGSFTVAVIPDTQSYRGREAGAQADGLPALENPYFEALTPWILEHLRSQRIVFVTHSGDIVDKNIPEQWEVARMCMDRLHGAVPYGIAPGNHDMTSAGDTSLFQQYFGAERFAGFRWYGGAYAGNPDLGPATSGNNANSYQLISAGGLDLLFLHLECNAPDDVLAWAEDVLARYPERKVFVTSHMSLGPLHPPTTAEGWFDDPKGRMLWHKRHKERGNTPQQLWEKLYSKHPNIMLVQTGDQSRTQAIRQSSRAEGGNIVHEMMFDYGGGRNIRLLRFMPAQNRIQAITWNVQDECLLESSDRVLDRGQWQFTLRQDLGGGAAGRWASTAARPHPALKWVARPMFR